ncbi:MAG: DoxX family protein [Taibaiella sp.]|nr:DoxX family protein [Taibaiella sp.]
MIKIRHHNTLLLRFIVAVILIIHGVPGMFNNGVYEFGKLFLDHKGFAPIGVPLAWAIKISHVIAAICLLVEKYVKWACLVTVIILIAGIVMVHLPNGWFVVGGGTNGIEFNVLLICALLTIMFPDGIFQKIARP